MRALVVALALHTAACASKVTATEAPDSAMGLDARGDASPPDDVSRDDVSDGGLDAGAPCAPISGADPFGVHLAGAGPIVDAGPYFDAAGTVNAAIDVYFPQGRVPGAEIVLVAPIYGGGSHVTYATLDATLSARGLRVMDPHCYSGVEGDLVGPSDGLVGTAINNPAAPSDVISSLSGPVRLCAAGAVRAQSITTPPAEVSPLSPLTIRGARPFAKDSFATVKATTASGVETVVVEGADPGVRIKPSGTTFSLFESVTFELSGLRDVLGGPLGLSSVRTVVPSTAVTDLTFATAPATTAHVGGPIAAVDGVLRVGFPLSTGLSPEEVQLALALGTTSKKTARLRHRVDCPSAASSTWSVRIVSPSASSLPIVPKCGAMADDVVVLPASGPYVLHATRPGFSPPPCNLSFFAPPTIYDLDELTFE